MTPGYKMSSDVGDKYKAVLNALITQNYHVINDVYLDMFVSHISGKTGEGMKNRSISRLYHPFILIHSLVVLQIL